MCDAAGDAGNACYCAVAFCVHNSWKTEQLLLFSVGFRESHARRPNENGQESAGEKCAVWR